MLHMDDSLHAVCHIDCYGRLKRRQGIDICSNSEPHHSSASIELQAIAGRVFVIKGESRLYKVSEGGT